MAIDSVNKLTIIAPLNIKDKLLGKLYELQVLHVTDAFSKEYEKEIERITNELEKEYNEKVDKLRAEIQVAQKDEEQKLKGEFEVKRNRLKQIDQKDLEKMSNLVFKRICEA